MKIHGKKVVDARRALELHIGKRDINGARKKEHTSCAAARALIRELGAMSALVGRSKTYVEFKAGWVRYATPAALRLAVMVFDRGGQFEPDTYVLLPPHKGQRLGDRENQPRGKGNGTRNPGHIFKGVRAALIRGEYHQHDEDRS